MRKWVVIVGMPTVKWQYTIRISQWNHQDYPYRMTPVVRIGIRTERKSNERMNNFAIVATCLLTLFYFQLSIFIYLYIYGYTYERTHTHTNTHQQLETTLSHMVLCIVLCARRARDEAGRDRERNRTMRRFFHFDITWLVWWVGLQLSFICF